MKEEEKIESSFSKWYAKNSKELNERRKKKYKADAELRERSKVRGREYRARLPKVAVQTVATAIVNGQEVAVYRIGEVARRIKRYEKTIRNWEKNKVIPKPTIKSAHRFYTEHQIGLLGKLAEVLSEVRYKPAIRKAAVSSVSDEIFMGWEE